MSEAGEMGKEKETSRIGRVFEEKEAGQTGEREKEKEMSQAGQVEEEKEAGQVDGQNAGEDEIRQISHGKKECYKRSDVYLAVLLLAGAWVYVKGDSILYGLRIPLFAILYLAAGCYCMKTEKRQMNRDGKVFFFYTAAAAGWFLLQYLPGNAHWTGQDVGPYVLLFIHGVGVYWLLVLGENRMNGCLDESGALDLARGLFVLPFVHFAKIFGLAWELAGHLKRPEASARKKQKTAAFQIFLGLLFSIPVLFLVLPMLMAADESFSAFAGLSGQWVKGLSRNILGMFSFFEILFHLLILTVGCYLFGLFYGAFRAKPPKIERKTELPPLFLFTFSGVICGVYLLFFLVKIVDAFGVFSGAGQGVVYSSFARQGFFELCFIAVLNFFLFYVIKCFSETGGGKAKIFLTLLSVETLFFIALAFSKMGLYISVYGLTFKRVFTSWFMCVLFVTFALLIRNVWRRANAIRPAVLFAASSFLLLAYSNMDGWILQVNRLMEVVL